MPVMQSREGDVMAVETQPVALVTGASAGIGEAAAHALVGAGFTVYGTSRRAAAGEKRGGVVFLPLDVTDDGSAAGVVREVLERSGRIDVLINNAGVGIAGAAEESSIEQARALFETNVFGSIRMTRAVLPHMREQGGGRIINVSSVLGLVPAPFMALYAATKHALEGYSESLDHEVREHGVRVLLVEPGYTNTAFDANAVAVDEPLALYARRREAFDVLTAAAVRAGDDPAVVSQVIVAAATDTRPRLRYPAGTLARRVSKLRRYVPPAIFDKPIRKTSQLAAWAQGGRPQPPQVRALGTAGPSHPGRRRSSTGSATTRRRCASGGRRLHWRRSEARPPLPPRSPRATRGGPLGRSRCDQRAVIPDGVLRVARSRTRVPRRHGSRAARAAYAPARTATRRG